MKKLAWKVGAFVVLALAVYVISVTRRGAAPASGIYAGEEIEMRKYVLFPVWNSRDSPLHHFLRQILEPSEARVIAARARAQKKTSNAVPGPQAIFEELGYKFPPGCYVEPAGGALIDIAHYPSMLERMERDLKIQPVSRGRP